MEGLEGVGNDFQTGKKGKAVVMTLAGSWLELEAAVRSGCQL